MVVGYVLGIPITDLSIVVMCYIFYCGIFLVLCLGYRRKMRREA